MGGRERERGGRGRGAGRDDMLLAWCERVWEAAFSRVFRRVTSERAEFREERSSITLDWRLCVCV